MTDAVKRHLRRAEVNLGGLYTVRPGYGLRGIMTVCAMRDAGLVERHQHAGDVLSAKGLAARKRLLANDAINAVEADVAEELGSGNQPAEEQAVSTRRSEAP